MIEVKLNGRGGGPAMTTATILASAFMRAGRQVQAFPSPEIPRLWAPCSAFLRVDDETISVRCAPTEFDHLVFFDKALLDLSGSLEGLKPSGWILLDHPGKPQELEKERTHIAAIDSRRIAELCGSEKKGKAVRAAAMAGAFARATGLLTVEALCDSIKESASSESSAQITAARVAYEEVSLKP